eukprot:11424252-Prorocentrum_lima.AAC.1
MTSSLVGSEMCIRDRYKEDLHEPMQVLEESVVEMPDGPPPPRGPPEDPVAAVSYTHLTLPTIC